ncbi:MAG: aldo/keto reductase [Pseudomonadales bacterium]
MNYPMITGIDTPCSQIGLGALHFGIYLNEREVNNLVNAAIDQGINFFETAPMYGEGFSEQLLGQALKGKKDKELIISTKAGLKPVSIKGQFAVQKARLTADYIRQSVESSLTCLARDTIDLFQLHAYDDNSPLEETTRVLESLAKEGKIRALGCSNYSPGELSQTMDAGLKFSTVQCHYNVLERRAGQTLKPMLRKHPIQLLCNRTLARGLLSGQYFTLGEIPKQSRAAKSERIKATLTHRVIKVINSLQTLAKEWGLSCSQLALRWILSQNAIPLLGVRTLEQLRQCCEAAKSSFSLEEINRIDQVVKDNNYWDIVNAQPAHYLEL